MAWTTGLIESIYRRITGTGDASLVVLEKADGTGVVAQAGEANGLKIEGDPAGAPVPISGAVTTDVDVSSLATQTTLAAVLAKIIAAPATAALQTALNGYVRPGTWTPATAAAASDGAAISAAATTVRKVVAANSHATTAVYLQLFDAASVPANGTAPRIPSVPIAAGQTVILDLGGMACAAGLSWASSSTVATKTITAITPLQVSAELV